MNETVQGDPASLFMLGLDAASLPFIRANLDRLPFLSSLIEEGSLADLQSPAAYLSASVWPTFYSGQPPGMHGQYFPFQWSSRDGAFRRIGHASWSDAFYIEPFWHRIARSGVTTIAFDIAHVLHDEQAPCLQITNWSYQSSGAANGSDRRVLQDITRRFGRRPIGAEVPVPKTRRECLAIRDGLKAAVTAKADATLYLMERPWDLFVTGWYEVHRAGHNLWPVQGEFASDAPLDSMLSVYEETDRQLARIWSALEKQGKANLVLFALHGMEPNRAQDHFLAEILSRLNAIYSGEGRKWSAKPSAPNVMAFLRSALPPGMQYRAASLLGERIQDWVVNRSNVGGRVWRNTLSFAMTSGGEGLVRLNVKGREYPGHFEPGSAELGRYVEWLLARLLDIRVAETEQRLIRNIHRVDDLFAGPRRHSLPDFVIEWEPEAPVGRIASPDFGEIEVSLATGRGGNHNASAFVMTRGDKALRAAFSSAQQVSDLGDMAQGFVVPANREQTPLH
ncbi:MAG TPA: alkaline phosphatase family protein [Sphingomicrobium sp.]|nr:alkaline phosphatase family protein [Sphingomicrobium sp.]